MGKRKRRQFTSAFKAQVVLEVLSGSKTQAEVCREHQLSPTLLATWRTIFVDNVESVFESLQDTSVDHNRIAELEQLAGRQALEIEILKKASTLLDRSNRNGRLS